eukprot:6204914-Pleurochrysis_carterae.AAC.4
MQHRAWAETARARRPHVRRARGRGDSQPRARVGRREGQLLEQVARRAVNLGNVGGGEAAPLATRHRLAEPAETRARQPSCERARRAESGRAAQRAAKSLALAFISGHRREKAKEATARC